MIFIPEIEVSSEDFIFTSTGNVIARSAVIHNAKGLEVPGGRVVIGRGATLHAEAAPIQLQRYVHVGENTTLKPCQTFHEPIRTIPQTIGANTIIGDNCLIEAAVIGTGCRIGNNCKLSPRCILKDFVRVLDDSVVLADMVLPPFAIVGGVPATIVGEQAESITTLAPGIAMDKYKSLKQIKSKENA